VQALPQQDMLFLTEFDAREAHVHLLCINSCMPWSNASCLFSWKQQQVWRNLCFNCTVIKGTNNFDEFFEDCLSCFQVALCA
jgi:hypothetical protein